MSRQSLLSSIFCALFFVLSALLAPAPARANPDPPRSTIAADEATAARVRRRLAQDDVVLHHRLDVSVNDGVLVLTGSARTRATLTAIVREVSRVPGVASVQVKAKVEPNP